MGMDVVSQALLKKYCANSLSGAGAIQGKDGFSPTIKENADNTEDIYKLDITTSEGTFTTPNLNGEGADIDLSKYTHYYKTVADMKADTSLKAGDMVITLGYYDMDDGGGAEYCIKSKVSSSINEIYTLSMDNTDVMADLVIKDKINVLSLGLKKDGVTDNTELLNNIIANSKTTTKTLYFPTGTYLFTDTINCNNLVNLVGEVGTVKTSTRATLKWDSTNMANKVCLNANDNSYKKMIKYLNFKSDAYTLTCDRSLLNDGGAISDTFSETINVEGVTGLEVAGHGTYVEDCYFDGFSSYGYILQAFCRATNNYAVNCKTGLYLPAFDCVVDKGRFYTCGIGMEISSPATNITNTRMDEIAKYGCTIDGETTGLTFTDFTLDYIGYCGVYMSGVKYARIEGKFNRCGAYYAGYSINDVPNEDIDKACGIFMTGSCKSNLITGTCGMAPVKDQVSSGYYSPAAVIGCSGSSQIANVFNITGNIGSNDNYGLLSEDEFDKLAVCVNSGSLIGGEIKYNGCSYVPSPLRHRAGSRYKEKVYVNNLIYYSTWITTSSAPTKIGLILPTANGTYISVGTNAGDWKKIDEVTDDHIKSVISTDLESKVDKPTNGDIALVFNGTLNNGVSIDIPIEDGKTASISIYGGSSSGPVYGHYFVSGTNVINMANGSSGCNYISVANNTITITYPENGAISYKVTM